MAAEMKVTDAAVAVALAAYTASRGSYEGEVPAGADDMRAALEAGLAAMLEPVHVEWERDGSRRELVRPTANDVQEGTQLTPMGFAVKETHYWKAHIGRVTGGDYPKQDIYRIKESTK